LTPINVRDEGGAIVSHAFGGQKQEDEAAMRLAEYCHPYVPTGMAVAWANLL